MSIFKASFPEFVQTELKNRQDRLSLPARRPELSIYQSTRNSFVRMTSGVSVDDSPDLAKKYVLQGGTLTNISPGVNIKKQGVGTSFDSAYSNKSALGDLYLRGMKPMPGITNMTAECKTAYGSLIEATVHFTCWDIKQLEDLELLFMRPGYTVLLEWGWSYNGQIPKFYDILDSSKNNLDFQQAYKDIFQKCSDNKGNYEAILGYVKNYQWSARPDGGYDCTTYIIAMGEVLESLKLNYAPLNINLVSSGSAGILKTYKPNTSSIAYPHRSNAIQNIKDYYSKGILSGLLYEIQEFMQAKTFPDATYLKGQPYPNIYLPNPNTGVYKPYSVFLKQWYFRNAKDNPIKSNVGDTYNYYITLESLCDLINTYVLPENTDTTGDKSLIAITTYDRNYQVSGSTTSDDLKCIAHPLQISTDVTRCLIKGDVWIGGQSKGITPPPTQSPTNNVVSSEVKKLAQHLGKDNFYYLFLKAMSSRAGTTTDIEEVRTIFKQIRKEIIYSILEIKPTYYVTDNNTIMFDECNGKQNEQFGFDIVKFITEGKGIEYMYNYILKLITNDQTIYDSNTSYDKNNNVQYTQAVRTFFLPDKINSNKPQPNKDAVIRLITDELLFQPLTYDNNQWGDYLIKKTTSQVVAETITTAKTALEGLGSLKEYFVNGSNYSSGHISNFYLDIDYLHSIIINQNLESRDPQGKNVINLVEFFKVICQTMQDCTGNINNFDIHIDGRDSIARIVDLNITPDAETDKLFQIELHNLKSTARNYKLESKIFPEQGAIIAISAQTFQESGQLGYKNSTLTSYNRGITDRLKPRVQVPFTADPLEKTKILLANFSQLLRYFSALGAPNYSMGSSYDPNSGTLIANTNTSTNTKYAPGAYNNVLRDALGFFSSLDENPNRFSGIIPVMLSLDMDGFGGAVIGNLFKINEEVLPKSYKFGNGGVGRQLGFLVKNFNHKIENNDWTTTIEAYPFIIPDTSRGETNNIQFWMKFMTEGIDVNTISSFAPVTSTTVGKTIPSGLVYPFNLDFVLKSPALEARISPTTGDLQVHGGSDLAIPLGTTIVTVYDGVVVESAYEDRAGNYIKISHTEGPLAGYTTIYMHLSKSSVKKGDKVKKSQTIGLSGNTGGSTGPHLHFEIRKTDTNEKVKPNIFFPGF